MIICLVGVTVLVGAASEIEKVSQVFQPDGPVFGGEFADIPQAEECLLVGDREDVADLRADAEDARAEAAQHRPAGRIVGDLLIDIADEADESCFDMNCDTPQSKWKSMPL